MTVWDKGFQLSVHRLLIYPVVNDDLNTTSYNEYATAKPLDKPMMPGFFKTI
jgi:acetyl esterase